MIEAATIGNDSWGNRTITEPLASDFARRMSISAEARSAVVKNLVSFPAEIMVRGLFFEGIFRIVEQRLGKPAVEQLRKTAGLSSHIVPFQQYPHRDFYKLYYLTAARLHPGLDFSVALQRVAQTFFPIFRGSLLGRTMSALMGTEPRTLLPLLSKAYGLSVSGNHHTSQMNGERELTWRCRVEPVDWYESTFQGIIEGTMSVDQRRNLKVTTKSKAVGVTNARYEFVIRW